VADFFFGALGIGVLFALVLTLACAFAGTTRPVKPGLMAGAAALPVALVAGLLHKADIIRDSMVVLLVGVAFLLVFLAALWRAYKQQASCRPIPKKMRLALLAAGFLPLICMMRLPNSLASVVSAALLLPFSLICMSCAVAGTTRPIKPGLIAGIVSLFFLVLLALLDSIGLSEFLTVLLTALLPIGLPFGVFLVLLRNAILREIPARPILIELRWCLATLAILPVLGFILRGEAMGIMLVQVALISSVVCLACAIMGDTRPVLPGFAAVAVGLLAVIWGAPFRGLDMGVAWFLVLILLIVPACTFAALLWFSISARLEARRIPPRIRWLLASPTILSLISLLVNAI